MCEYQMAHSRLLITLTVVLLSVSACSTGHYGKSIQGSYNTSARKGSEASKAKDYEAAAVHYSFAAKSGHPKALISYGELFSYGRGVERDPVRANQLLEEAYGKSSPYRSKAAYALGRLLLDGGDGPSGTLPADQPRARTLLVEALNGGQTRAASSLGKVYDRGIGVPEDAVKAIAYYEQVAETDASAARRLPYLLAEIGAPEKRIASATNNATAQLERQAKEGKTKAWFQLADLHMDDQIMNPDPESAIAYLQNVTEDDHPEVLTRLATLYGEIGDTEQERSLLRKAADIGDEDAQTKLARLFLKAGTSDTNGPVGRYYAERAIAQDSKDAMVYLGTALLRGKVLPPDPSAGETLLRRASDAGSNRGIVALGASLLRSEVAPRFPGEGQQLLEQAAQNGSSGAMATLGFAYQKGRGLPQDPVAALQWLQRAAEAGHVRAQKFMAEQTGA